MSAHYLLPVGVPERSEPNEAMVEGCVVAAIAVLLWRPVPRWEDGAALVLLCLRGLLGRWRWDDHGPLPHG